MKTKYEINSKNENKMKTKYDIKIGINYIIYHTNE